MENSWLNAYFIMVILLIETSSAYDIIKRSGMNQVAKPQINARYNISFIYPLEKPQIYSPIGRSGTTFCIKEMRLGGEALSSVWSHNTRAKERWVRVLYVFFRTWGPSLLWIKGKKNILFYFSLKKLCSVRDENCTSLTKLF